MRWESGENCLFLKVYLIVFCVFVCLNDKKWRNNKETSRNNKFKIETKEIRADLERYSREIEIDQR